MTDDRHPAQPKTNAEIFMELIGKPMPAPMTPEQRADYDAWNAAAEADADRIYAADGLLPHHARGR